MGIYKDIDFLLYVPNKDSDTDIKSVRLTDYDYWKRMESWKLEESCFLLVNIDPRAVDITDFYPFTPHAPSGSAGNIYETARRSNFYGSWHMRVTPSKFIQWAKDKGFIDDKNPFLTLLNEKINYEQEYYRITKENEALRVELDAAKQSIEALENWTAHSWPWGDYETSGLQHMAEVIQRNLQYLENPSTQRSLKTTIKIDLANKINDDRGCDTLAKIIVDNPILKKNIASD